MPATLEVRREVIGVAVRRGTFDVFVDGERVGSVELRGTLEMPIEPGPHTLLIRSGRNSSPTRRFDAAEGQVVTFVCNGKGILPLFLASFVVPTSAIKIRRD